MVISLYIVILLTGFLIFIICAFADSSLLIFDIGCIVGFFVRRFIHKVTYNRVS